MMYSLEEVVEAFESWRASRISRSEVIPKRLWSMTKALLPHYKKSHIQKAFRISGKHFIKHCLDQNKSKNEAIVEGFAIAEVVPERSNNHRDHCEITIKGTQRSLHIKLPTEQLPQVLAATAGYL
jgi:hypothetical protein